jgi:hypothetical protein
MGYKNFFCFVVFEILVVAIATAVALFLAATQEPSSELMGDSFGMLYLAGVGAALSLAFSALPILLGALLTLLAAALQPKRFTLWSFVCGVLAAIATYLPVYSAGLISELTKFTIFSLAFFGLIIIPSLIVWQMLAKKYLRDAS